MRVITVCFFQNNQNRENNETDFESKSEVNNTQDNIGDLEGDMNNLRSDMNNEEHNFGKLKKNADCVPKDETDKLLCDINARNVILQFDWDIFPSKLWLKLIVTAPSKL